MPDPNPAAPASPWWLSDGDETCPHCEAPYHLGQERRCPGCDRPSCAHCVDRASGRCAECRAAAAQETP